MRQLSYEDAKLAFQLGVPLLVNTNARIKSRNPPYRVVPQNGWSLDTAIEKTVAPLALPPSLMRWDWYGDNFPICKLLVPAGEVFVFFVEE